MGDHKMNVIKIFVIFTSALHCDGVSIFEQLEHIAARRLESQRGLLKRNVGARRFGLVGGETSVILGSPSNPSHLPAAEPILPGHTLLRPAMGMLKSAVKFPHREQENGAGVYGHIDNLGIRYDGKNERVMYTGFRKMLPNAAINNYILRRNKPRRFSKNILQLKKRSDMRSVIGEVMHIVETRTPNLKRALQLTFRRNKDMENKNRDAFRIRMDPDISALNSEERKFNRSKLFWETQNSFNHVKISPYAPEYHELLPIKAAENTRDWWFYHQSDFEDFAERRSKDN